MSTDLSRLLPERNAWLRAAVASIPVVGAAFDHLLFDKADAIRLKNLEAAIAALSAQLNDVQAASVDKSWFQSEEALAVFKMLADKASYEPDPAKVSALGRVVAACGDVQHSADERKLAVVEHLSRLSATQIRLLAVVASVAPVTRKISTGGLEQTVTAVWQDKILEVLRAGLRFWTGTMALDQELELLESFNVLRRVQLMGPAQPAFALTHIGKLAATYVETAGLGTRGKN